MTLLLQYHILNNNHMKIPPTFTSLFTPWALQVTIILFTHRDDLITGYLLTSYLIVSPQ